MSSGAKHRVWVIAAAVVALTGVAFYLSTRHATTGAKKAALPMEKPNVLLITLDTTRVDHLSAYGFRGARTPNLEALARQGVLFRECAGVAPLTLPAHCSILTGTYPTYHGVRVNGNTALSAENRTLAEEYAAAGYQTGAFVGAFVLDGRWGLNQGFQHYDDQFDLKKFRKLDLGMVQRPGNEVVDRALEWLDQRKDKPFFAWVHLYDPHMPYEPPEPYRSEYAAGGLAGLYDGEIAFVDEQIGRCLQWLDRNGLRNHTIVAVIGDHGEGLGDHGEMTHGYFIYDYAVHVPFILSAPLPGYGGREIRAQVRSIDLAPTLLQASGIPIPPTVQGVPLWRLIDSDGKGQSLYAYSESMTPSIQYGWAPLLSLRSPNYKYIDAPRPELFRLEKDPGESRDIHAEYPKVAGDYNAMLKTIVAESAKGAPAAAAANLDSETVERLAALGYIGAPVSPKPAQSTTILVDPKDKLAVHEAISRAGELNNDDNYDESARILEDVLRDDPGNPQARLLLAADYVELKRPEDAKPLLNGLLEEDPQNIRALVSLASILQEEGRPDEVIRLSRKALEMDDRNTRALEMMGQSYMDQNRFDEALPWLEKAVEVQPKMTQNQLNLAACRIGLKQYDAAEPVLRTLLQENPKFPRAHYHLALLYEGQNRLQDARKEYETEIRDYENYFVARFNLGRLLLRLGDHEGYMQQMREVMRIAPNHASGYLFYARGLLQENANTDEILKIAEKGLSLARTAEYKAMGYFLLADIYTRKKEPAQVQQALDKANHYKAQIGKESS